MKEYETIHLLACDYAENCEKQILANREKLNEKPLTHDQLQMTWLNHYDGFAAGYRAATEEQNKERDERLIQLLVEKLALGEEKIREMVLSGKTKW